MSSEERRPVSPVDKVSREESWELCPAEAAEAEGDSGEGGVDDDSAQAEQHEADEQGAVACRPVRDPGTPSAAERAAHELTHWPYRSWCKACVAGMATGLQHRHVKPDDAMSDVTRVIMDFAYLKENVKLQDGEHEKSEVAESSLTMIILMETRFGSTWAYPVEGKSIEQTEWAGGQIIDDLASIGITKERIIVKNDGEAALVALQHGIVKRRAEFESAVEIREWATRTPMARSSGP